MSDRRSRATPDYLDARTPCYERSKAQSLYHRLFGCERAGQMHYRFPLRPAVRPLFFGKESFLEPGRALERRPQASDVDDVHADHDASGPNVITPP